MTDPMTVDQLTESLTTENPPAMLSPPAKALWWLKKGDLATGADWDAAHEICQQAEGTPDYDWVHGLAHLIEGDAANATYWYRRAGRTQVSDNLDAEWRSIAAHLLAGT